MLIIYIYLYIYDEDGNLLLQLHAMKYQNVKNNINKFQRAAQLMSNLFIHLFIYVCLSCIHT